MKSHIKIYAALILPVFLIAACASTKVVDETPNNTIESISTSQGNASIPYANTTTVKLSRDLSLNKVVKNYKGSTTVNKTVKISPAQFDSLVKTVKHIDLSKLESIEQPPLVGSGNTNLLIVTDKGSYSFHKSYRSDFPPVIAQLFSDLEQLIPVGPLPPITP